MKITRIDENTIEKEQTVQVKKEPLLQMKKNLEYQLGKVNEELQLFETKETK